MKVTGYAVQMDVIVVCACLLGVIALLLLYRCCQLDWRNLRLRQQLQAEKSQRMASEQALVDIRGQLSRTLATHDRIQETERQRIARDLHDDLGQQLLALTMEVCALASADPAVKEPLAAIDNHLRQAIRSLRCIIKDLAPDALERGLRAAMEGQLEQFSRLSGIRCTLQADADAFKATADVRFQTMLYRLLQESLSNIARHARASAVEVALCRQSSALSLTVRDNGVGLPQTNRRGLGSIGQRVAAAGGQLHVDSAPGQGTAVSMSFPLELVLPQA